MTSIGWMLAGLGASVMLIGICVLAFASRSDAKSDSDSASDSDSDPNSDPDSQPAGSEPTPVMDAVQREDLERRARARAAQSSESARATTSDAALGGGIIAVGLAAAVFGVILLGISSSQVSDDKGQLRLAAANLVTGAVDGPAVCRQSAALESQEWPSLASSPYAQSAANCGGSPREYAQSSNMTSYNVGVFIPVEYVFSQSFSTNGEVTVHDKQDNRSLCVTVPDTDVAAAAQASATPSTDGYGDGDGDSDGPTSSPGALPFFDDVSVDPSPYIASGACPDAPVGSSGSS